MKLLSRFSVALVVCALAWPASATPVGPMNYQGRLLDDGVPVGYPTPVAANFVVKIYDDPVAGTLKYQESHNAVVVDDGVYSFKVGTGSNVIGSWDINLWQANLNDLYLEVVVNGETLSPRQELTSAPHAFTSTLALSAGALGNKSAAEFDNILEGVCVASKGAWLEKVGKCLGAGASFPGPTLVPLRDLTDKYDLKGLDLASADISGINFSINSNYPSPPLTNLSYSVFKNTTYSVEGLNKTIIGKTEWDGAVATDSAVYNLNSQTNLAGALFKNMNLDKWNLSGITSLGYVSAANLSGCPTGLPVNWVCVAMDNPAGARFVLLGPGVNLSASSAAKVDTFGANTLDVHRNIFDNKNLAGADFQGISFNKQTFTNTNLNGAVFDYARLTRVFFEGTDLTNASFANADMKWIAFFTGTIVNGTNFSNASLVGGGMQVGMSNVDFSYATVEDIQFEDINNASFVELLGRKLNFNGISGTVDFTNAILLSDYGTSILFKSPITGNLVFENIRGNSVLEFYHPIPPSTVFNGGEFGIIGNMSGVTISNATIDTVLRHTGDFNAEGPTLTNVSLRGINFGSIANSTSSGPNLRYATFTGSCALLDNTFIEMSQSNFTGTDFGSCIGQIPLNSNWFMTWCPDGTNSSDGTDSNSCLDGQMTPAPGP